MIVGSYSLSNNFGASLDKNFIKFILDKTTLIIATFKVQRIGLFRFFAMHYRR
jgi:hypothetical protein